MTLKELREKRAAQAAAISAFNAKIVAENRAYTPEEEANWTAINAEYDALDAQCKRAERVEAVNASATQVGDAESRVGRDDADGRRLRPGAGATPTTEQRNLAVQGWMLAANDLQLEERHIDAARATGIRIDAGHLDVQLTRGGGIEALQRQFRTQRPELASRALSGQVGSSGGYTIPEELVSNLELNMLAFGGMLQTSEILRSARGGTMTWPTASDTGNSGRQIGESAAVSTTTDPTFGAVTWSDYKFTSDAILVPQELIEDSPMSLPVVLGQMLGERVGRILNAKSTTGTGAATPKGVTICAATGKTTASATAITFAEVLDLIHSVDPSYRNGAGFMFHDSVLLYLKKLVDGQQRPLWINNVAVSQPDTIWGYPYTINQDMASSVATGLTTMIFGQLNKYKIRQVNTIRMYRLDERYRENDQTGFMAFTRADGNLLTASSTNTPIKKMIQA